MSAAKDAFDAAQVIASGSDGAGGLAPGNVIRLGMVFSHALFLADVTSDLEAALKVSKTVMGEPSADADGTGRDGAYVLVKGEANRGCYSLLGKTGPRQPLNLGKVFQMIFRYFLVNHYVVQQHICRFV